MSKKILVTGVSGSGKSTLESIFRQKGYSTSDIDNGFAEWRYKESDKPLGHHPINEEVLSLVHWALRAEALKERLEADAGENVLIFGSTNDLHQYVGLFNRVFLLEYPHQEAILDRLATRPDSGYGKVPHERDSVLSYFEDYQSMMKQLGAKEVNCMLPIDQIVEVIEGEIQDE